MARIMINAAIFGAGGGIGAALTEALREEGAEVTAFTRADCDITDEESVRAAAAKLAGAPPTLVIVAAGLLHHADHGPEKALAQFDPAWAARNFAVNAIGPTLVAKHVLPLMPIDRRIVFAAMSARVGSIADNRLGGWHAYRASKAALNQLIRTIAVEQARRNGQSVVVGLHPGTVETALSAPFRGNVAAGTRFTPDRAAVQLLDLIDGLKAKDSGKLFAWDGEEIQP